MAPSVLPNIFFYVPRLPNPISMHPWFCIHSRLVFSTFLWKILEVNLRQGWVFIWKMPSFFQKGLIFFKKCSVFWPKMFTFFQNVHQKAQFLDCVLIWWCYFLPLKLWYIEFSPYSKKYFCQAQFFPWNHLSIFFLSFFLELSFLKMSKEQAWFIVSAYCLIVNVRMVK